MTTVEAIKTIEEQASILESMRRGSRNNLHPDQLEEWEHRAEMIERAARELRKRPPTRKN